MKCAGGVGYSWNFIAEFTLRDVFQHTRRLFTLFGLNISVFEIDRVIIKRPETRAATDRLALFPFGPCMQLHPSSTGGKSCRTFRYLQRTRGG